MLVARATDPDSGADSIVGTVRGIPRADGTVDVGRLAVDDGWEGRGIGTALMVALEAAYPDAPRFELFTGRDAQGPIFLYTRLGYTITGDRELAPGVHLIWMEKCRSGRVDSGQ
jgi:ribosomal protein S18 acetylase RimI-like enzyme